jgi:hypothetical protein
LWSEVLPGCSWYVPFLELRGDYFPAIVTDRIHFGLGATYLHFE